MSHESLLQIRQAVGPKGKFTGRDNMKGEVPAVTGRRVSYNMKGEVDHASCHGHVWHLLWLYALRGPLPPITATTQMTTNLHQPYLLSTCSDAQT
jgi:hypothetical protein